MVINISVQYNGGLLSPRQYTVDPRLLPVGNPVKYHVVALHLLLLSMAWAVQTGGEYTPA